MPYRPPEIPLQAKVWSRVDVRQQHECWPWRGRVDRFGYGRLTVMRGGRRASELAHRLAFDLVCGVGSPDVVMHTCDNPPCCNPFHLRRGSQKDNMDDMRAKGRAVPARIRLNPIAAGVIRFMGRRGSASLEDLASAHGVTHETVRRIVSGKTWKRLAALPAPEGSDG